MKLPIPFLNSKKNDSEYYLALLLTEDKASAIILKENETILKTISTHEEYFPHSIEDLSLENFIDVVDKTISRAEEVLPPQIETHKTVFGVKDKWVDKETKKIKKEYLDKLKKVCDALDLQPIGFMVTTEAITNLIQEEEGAPLSAVVAEIGDKQVSLFLLRGGKVIESISSTLMHSAPHTVDKLLSHFTVPVLPARIVLYINKPDEEANQAFISHQWSKSLPFLHVPQITVLPNGFDMRSITFGAGQQMGFTVAVPPHERLPKLTKEEKKDEEQFEEKVLDEEVSEHPEDSEVEEKKHDEDEEQKEEKDVKMDNIAPVTDPDAQAGDFGFVVNGEPKDKPVHHAAHTEHHKPEHHERAHHESELEIEDDEPRQKHHSKGSLTDKLPFLASLPALSLPKNIKMPNVGGMMNGLKGNKAPLKIIIPVVAILALLIGTSIFYVNGVKATVSLVVSPNIVNEEAEVTFSASSPNDFSKRVIAARNVSTSLPAQLSTTATGKKDVGEKAKGGVTIYNNSDDPIRLSAGTEIKASNGKVFVLDKDTTVAASSGDIFTGTKPGTTDAAVTAKDLGTEGNIPSGTRFSIGSTSTLAARNDSAFSGGTKKNVTVVSKNDLEKLRKEAIASVEGDAKEKLLSEAKTNETVLPVVGEATLENVKFDKKEGDEASKVTMTANVVFIGMAYSNDELKDFAETIVKNEYAEDITIAENSVKTTVKDAEMEDGKTVRSSLAIEAGLLPQIDTQEVTEKIQDKSLGQARETLSNLPQVAKTDIAFSPPIFIIPDLFPRLPNQISVEVKTE